MKRHLFLMLLVPNVLAILSIVAIWTQLIPKYKAMAEIRVRPIIPRLVYKTEENGMIPLYNSFVNTQASIIKSPVVLQRALDQKEVQETQWCYNPSRSFLQKIHENPVSPMERLRNELVAKPRNDTEIIDVSLVAEKGEDAKVIVDAVLEQYIKYISQRSNAIEDTLYRQLTDQYNSLNNQITVQERDLASLRKLLGTETPQELISAKRMRLDEKHSRLSELQHNIALLEKNIEQSVNNDSNDLSTGQINHSQQKNSNSLKQQLTLVKNEQELLIFELDEQRKELDYLFADAQRFEEANERLAHSRELYNAVRERLDQKNMERNVPGPIEISMRAIASSQPYRDYRTLFTVIILVLWLVICSLIIFLPRKRADKR